LISASVSSSDSECADALAPISAVSPLTCGWNY
jgi:hypothetical protein